jgi:hypothetical protein
MMAYRRTFCRWLRPLAALALVLGLSAGAARADHLDAQLNDKGNDIVEVLRKKGVKNVGVLRFRVKEGNRAETFNAGPLNGNLAVRLENVLVMHAGSDEKDALGVIHNAGETAAQHKVGKWHDSEAEQRKLFAVESYPLAWGNKKVKADAFLTGLVKISSDYKHGTVVIEMMRTPGKVEKLTEVAFDGDPSLLLDLGKSYSLSKRSLGSARTAAKTRDLVFEEVKKRNDTATGDTNPGTGDTNPGTGNSGTTPGGNGDQPVVNKDSIEVGGVEFQILSGGQPVAIKAKDGANNGGYQIESPEPGKEVVFKITNKTDKTLGVDVKLNGSSVFLEQTDDPANCRVFILKPEEKYRSYTLRGYIIQESEDAKPKVAPFKVLVGEEAQKWRESAGQLADKAGTLSITVFEEGDQTGTEMLVSARGVKKHQDKAARANLGLLQRSLMKAGHLKRDLKQRELIVADKDSMKEVEGIVKSADFTRKTVAIGSATISVLPKATTTTPTDGGN